MSEVYFVYSFAVWVGSIDSGSQANHFVDKQHFIP